MSRHYLPSNVQLSELHKSGKLLISANTSWKVNNHSRNLVRSLVSKGFDVAVAAPQDEYSEELKRLGCRYIPIEMDAGGKNPLKDGLLFLRYYRIMRQERPDVFLSWTIKPNVYGGIAAQLMGVPVINNISGLGLTFISNNLLTRVAIALYMVALRRSRCVFFQNKDDKSLFLRLGLVQKHQASLLPGSGVDLAHFSPAGDRADPPAANPAFILVSRLIWDKGIAEYIEAARLVRLIVPGARFQLLGSLEAKNPTAIPPRAVKGWVDEGLVEYLGMTDDVRPYIAAADCVVLPSYREGTPRCLLEAAAMAKPLIATNVPGCREVVDDGKNGFLCEAKSPNSLASKMLQFIHMDYPSRVMMGANSRKKAQFEFNEDIVVARYLETISRLILRVQ